ncbi:phosphate signaling complex protein PhoU [Aliikangiella coralliicola]|uniref:Phosphate-specific transport system accessory protein PhoU n=1 Tax=Aliikangiella coralliicola TaxID=2592383 RepID=A0A545UHK2_9GAMM|nr:phosphate signaling complex protein PhoU [Aliikangiella coralliicola]TQV88942.1 phosphate signaling complex protein PhoU [Aliikangiella coralliicola]
MENDLNLSHHISKRFNEELEEVRNQVLKMGGVVEQQVREGLKSLLDADQGLAQRVVDTDIEVNTLEVEIDENCTKILARRQPAASDLRLMISIIKTITDLERIGDEAAKLGKNALKLHDDGKIARQFIELRHLGEHVSATLNKALTAYARLDVNEALEIIQNDRFIDEEFDNISRLLITKMMEDPREIKSALRISWCARALERIGDHTKNICEYIVYLVKGKDVRHTSIEEIKQTITE